MVQYTTFGLITRVLRISDCFRLCVVLLSVVEADQNEKCVQSNGVEHAEPSEDARAAICTSLLNGSTDAEC